MSSLALQLIIYLEEISNLPSEDYQRICLQGYINKKKTKMSHFHRCKKEEYVFGRELSFVIVMHFLSRVRENGQIRH